MAMMTLQDLTDRCEGVIFSDGYSKCATALEKAGTLLFVMGRVDRKRSEAPQIIVSDVLTVDQALSRSLHRLDVHVPPGTQSASEVQDHLRSLQKHQSGEGASLHVFVTVDGVEVEIRAGFKLRPSLDLYQQLIDSFGSESVNAYVEGLEPTEPARFGVRRS